MPKRSSFLNEARLRSRVLPPSPAAPKSLMTLSAYCVTRKNLSLPLRLLLSITKESIAFEVG